MRGAEEVTAVGAEEATAVGAEEGSVCVGGCLAGWTVVILQLASKHSRRFGVGIGEASSSER